MTLQSSGAISMNDINVELGRSGTTTIGLNQAESGTYGAINTASSSRPNGSTPNSMNEWYGYNHNAVNCFNLGTVNYYPDGTIGAGCCNFTNTATLYSDCSSLGVNCTVYQSSNCTSPVNGYAMTTDFSTAYFANNQFTSPQGKITYSQACYC